MNTVWKRIFEPFIQTAKLHQPLRTTYVLKRTHEARLRKSHKFPSLRKKHFIYEAIETNQRRREEMSILLTQYVDNLGQPGDIVNVREKDGRYMLITKCAVYPTPENAAKYGKKSLLPDEMGFSSKYVRTTLQALSKFIVNVSMNKENPWTLEPWHIRSAFRKAHVVVPESAITMPEYPIKGPDLSLEDKEFFVTVTINKKEKAVVRCRLHHWATNPEERLVPKPLHWKFPAELMFPEDKEIAKKLPEIIPPELDEDQQILQKPQQPRGKPSR